MSSNNRLRNLVSKTNSAARGIKVVTANTTLATTDAKEIHFSGASGVTASFPAAPSFTGDNANTSIRYRFVDVAGTAASAVFSISGGAPTQLIKGANGLSVAEVFINQAYGSVEAVYSPDEGVIIVTHATGSTLG